MAVNCAKIKGQVIGCIPFVRCPAQPKGAQSQSPLLITVQSIYAQPKKVGFGIFCTFGQRIVEFIQGSSW